MGGVVRIAPTPFLATGAAAWMASLLTTTTRPALPTPSVKMECADASKDLRILQRPPPPVVVVVTSTAPVSHHCTLTHIHTLYLTHKIFL